MCGRGRYALRAKEKIYKATRATIRSYKNNPVSPEHIDQHRPLDNVATSLGDCLENISPGMSCPILVCFEGGLITTEQMTWGLVPAYESITNKPDHYRLFNKRVDTLLKPGYFRNLVECKRCVVVWDGFYEWKSLQCKKVPHYVSLKESSMQIAGIYELSRRLNGDTGETESFYTFSILTGEPSFQFSSLHNREPVLLTDPQMFKWLDPRADLDTLLAEMIRNPTDVKLSLNSEIQFHAVTSQVTNPKYQGEDCSYPVQQPSTTPSITSYFKKGSVSPPVGKRSLEDTGIDEGVSSSGHGPTPMSGNKRSKSSSSACNKLSTYFNK